MGFGTDKAAECEGINSIKYEAPDGDSHIWLQALPSQGAVNI